VPLPQFSFVDTHNFLATVPLGEQGGIAGLTPGVVPNPLFGQPVIGHADVVGIDRSRLSNPSTIDLSSDANIWGAALVLSYDFDWFNLKSITSYRDTEARTGFNTAALAQTVALLGNTYDTDQLSQELQLSGKAIGDRLSWLVGAYHFEQDGVNLDDVNFTPVRILSGAKIDNRNSAGFAQATFAVTDKLAITAGFRHTSEQKDYIVPQGCYPLPSGAATLFDGTVVSCAQLQSVIDPRFTNQDFLLFSNAPVFPDAGGRFCCLPVADAAGNIVGLIPGLTAGQQLLPRGTYRQSFSQSTPHANVAYRWNEALMSYVSYSQGFKSGGFVQRVFPPRTAPPEFAPETARVYEAGLKWTSASKRLRGSLAVFHTQYRDMQIQVNDGVAAVTRNAAEAGIDGFELDFTAIPAANWLVEAGVGYLDARYTKLGADQNLVTDILTLNRNSKLVNAPDWTTNLGVQYAHPFSSHAQLRARADWRYISTVYKDALNFPALRQPGYGLLDLTLTFVPADARWELSAFGKNVTDERYIVSGYASALTFGTASASPGRPAEWGISFAYHFGE
jgi:iron complex outermembrane receptor protein